MNLGALPSRWRWLVAEINGYAFPAAMTRRDEPTIEELVETARCALEALEQGGDNWYIEERRPQPLPCDASSLAGGRPEDDEGLMMADRQEATGLAW